MDGSPIIVVGAGRSGTKLLRGVLASHPEVVCFPREINYIWRHGNTRFPTDELKPHHARPKVVDYIRGRFEDLRVSRGGARVVEKTCANVLRIDFVHAVFPEACIIHVVRDGRAVAESARRRWQAPPDPRYLLEKARWIPVSDMPYYFVRYLYYQLGRLGSGKTVQTSWGPRFTGLDELVREKTLIEVCGLQWSTCVQAAHVAMKRLPPEQAITVHYEDLVSDPLSTAEWVFQRVQLAFSPESRHYVNREVHRDNLGKWQANLSDEDLRLLVPLIQTELTKQGYEL